MLSVNMFGVFSCEVINLYVEQTPLPMANMPQYLGHKTYYVWMHCDPPPSVFSSSKCPETFAFITLSCRAPISLLKSKWSLEECDPCTFRQDATQGWEVWVVILRMVYLLFSVLLALFHLQRTCSPTSLVAGLDFAAVGTVFDADILPIREKMWDFHEFSK